MKKTFFISAIILLIVFNSSAQSHQHGDAVSMNQPDSKKIRFRSSLEVANYIKLPSDGDVALHINGKLLLIGHVRKQKLHGNWVSYYVNNNKIDSGYLKNGIPDGAWKRWDSSGQLLSIRHYDAVKLQQVKEEIRLAHPKRSFYSLTALSNTNRAQALYIMSPSYSFSFPEKQRSAQSIQQVVENNGNSTNAYTPVFNECLHHGLYINYFHGGITKDSGYYKNGLKEAVWLHRNSPGGYYFIGSYKNGLRFREWKQYDTTGKLHSIIFYNREGLAAWTKIIRR